MARYANQPYSEIMAMTGPDADMLMQAVSGLINESQAPLSEEERD